MANIMEMGKNPNYLGSYDLYDLNTTEITVTIKNFVEEEVITNGQNEKCAVMYFEEKYKPMIINPTNKKTLAKLYHSVMTEKLIGKKITIHIEKVKAFGTIHDALRIKPIKPAQEKEIKCESCGKKITASGQMSSEQVAAYNMNRFRKKLCAACASEEHQRLKKAKVFDENKEMNYNDTDC